DGALLYRIALDELRDVLVPHGEGARRASFFRFVDADGDPLAPTDPRAGLHEAAGRSRWERPNPNAALRAAGPRSQQVGYLAPEVAGGPALHEVIVTSIVDPVKERRLGALAVGFPVEDFGGRSDGPLPDGGASPASLWPIRGGIWFEG